MKLFFMPVLGLLISLFILPVHAQATVTLEQAIALAMQNDPWMHGNTLKQKATEYKAIGTNTLPDPKVSISMMNLPTDSWSLDQEAMTQLSIGISQMFPRGDSLSIKQSQLKIEASKYPLLLENRKAKLTAKVSQLWLDAYLAQQTIKLIEADRALFEQMAEVARANYSTAVGKTRQQDVIRAQLEIVQLEDRLANQKLLLETAIARLNEWLHRYDHTNLNQALNFDTQPLAFNVSDNLPVIKVAKPALLKTPQFSRNKLAQVLANHPAVLALDIKTKVSEKNIELAKQQYKMQWGVNARYGIRDDMPSGQERADLFSVGVSFDLPLFTENKQDKQLAASVFDTEATKTEKLLLIKEMISGVEKAFQQLNRLSERQRLYKEQLLKQIHDQAEASLTAYTNDDGDFAEVVRARIAELNARIMSLKIDVDALKTVAGMNYFFAESNNTYKSENTSLMAVQQFGEH